MQATLGRIGVTSAETSSVNHWINQVIREDICADHNWSAMETLTTAETTTLGTGTKTWPGASTYKDTIWVQIRVDASSEFQRLTEVSEDVALDPRYFPELSTAYDLPVAWARSGSSYLLRPIPDATYTLRIKYIAYPADFDLTTGGDSSTNFVTLYYSQLLEYGVIARACLFYGESDLWQKFVGIYRDELGKAISVDRRVQSPARMTLKPSLVAGRATPGLPGGGSWLQRVRGAYS